MKSFVLVGTLAVSALAQQTAQFANTSFTGPFVVGQTAPVSWTVGNGLPVSLSIANSTWTHSIFAGRAVLPTTYAWVVDASVGLVSGDYQLVLSQINGGVSNSPFFGVLTGNTSATGTTASQPVTTVTYVYWEEQCGCHQTATAIAPVNSSLPALTSSWWDHQCGCTKSTVVPVTVLPTANNYTLPTAPPVTTTSAAASPASPATSTTAGSAAAATFTGNAVKIGSSVFGLAALLAAAVIV